MAATLIASNPNNLFYTKRPFDIEIMETGYKFIWQQTERPDYYKFHPKDSDELKKRLNSNSHFNV